MLIRHTIQFGMNIGKVKKNVYIPVAHTILKYTYTRLGVKAHQFTENQTWIETTALAPFGAPTYFKFQEWKVLHLGLRVECLPLVPEINSPQSIHVFGYEGVIICHACRNHHHDLHIFYQTGVRPSQLLRNSDRQMAVNETSSGGRCWGAVCLTDSRVLIICCKDNIYACLNCMYHEIISNLQEDVKTHEILDNVHELGVIVDVMLRYDSTVILVRWSREGFPRQPPKLTGDVTVL